MRIDGLAIAIVLVGSVAGAGTLHGEKAEALTQALRYAGIKPTTANGTRTFRVATISCLRMLEGDVVLGDHRCTLDKLELKDVGAYVLYVALTGAGLQQKVETETHIKIAGSNLACTIDATSQFACTGDGISGDPIQITPKKTKTKGVVQQIKIEKQ